MINETFQTILFMIGVILLCLLTACFSAYQCRTKAVMQELDWSWGPIQGCMVKQDGKWIDYDRLRYMND